MLIKKYELRLESPPCDPGSECWSAFARVDTDISEVLPYLNTKLNGAIYDHKAQVLTWRKGGRAISIRSHEIAVSNLQDRAEAEAMVKRMVDLVNKTWKQREQIQPSLVRREPLKALDVYKLLSGSNCKACGQPTCFTFALKLVAGQADITSCGSLFEEAHREQRERLLQMLEAAGITP